MARYVSLVVVGPIFGLKPSPRIHVVVMLYDAFARILQLHLPFGGGARPEPERLLVMHVLNVVVIGDRDLHRLHTGRKLSRRDFDREAPHVDFPDRQRRCIRPDPARLQELACLRDERHAVPVAALRRIGEIHRPRLRLLYVVRAEFEHAGFVDAVHGIAVVQVHQQIRDVRPVTRDDGTDDELVRVRIVHYPLVLLHRQPRRVDVLARRAGVGEPHLAPAAHALVDAEGCREVLLGCRQHTVVVILEAAVVGAITHHRLHRGPAVERKLRHRHRFELDRVVQLARIDDQDRAGLLAPVRPGVHLWLRTSNGAVLEHDFVLVAEDVTARAIHPVAVGDLVLRLVEEHALAARRPARSVLVLEIDRDARDAVGVPCRRRENVERQHLVDVVQVDDRHELVVRHPGARQQVEHVRLRIDRALGRLSRREIDVERAQLLDRDLLAVIRVAGAQKGRFARDVRNGTDHVVERASARGIDRLDRGFEELVEDELADGRHGRLALCVHRFRARSLDGDIELDHLVFDQLVDGLLDVAFVEHELELLALAEVVIDLLPVDVRLHVKRRLQARERQRIDDTDRRDAVERSGQRRRPFLGELGLEDRPVRAVERGMCGAHHLGDEFGRLYLTRRRGAVVRGRGRIEQHELDRALGEEDGREPGLVGQTVLDAELAPRILDHLRRPRKVDIETEKPDRVRRIVRDRVEILAHDQQPDRRRAAFHRGDVGKVGEIVEQTRIAEVGKHQK